MMDLNEAEAKAAAGRVRFAVSRRINGITLNSGVEYLIGEDGKPLLFGSVWDAFYFLKSHGYTVDSMDAEGIKIVIVECDADAE